MKLIETQKRLQQVYKNFTQKNLSNFEFASNFLFNQMFDSQSSQQKRENQRENLRAKRKRNCDCERKHEETTNNQIENISVLYMTSFRI